MEVPKTKTIAFYHLRTSDGKYKIFRRTEQPPLVVDELFTLDCSEDEANECINELNADQIDEEERETTT